MTTSFAFRSLGLEHGDAAALLETGVRILDALPEGGPSLRWYVAPQPTLVLGRGQALPTTLPTTLATTLPVVQRHSGGGAVLMDADLLSLDVVLPAGHPWLDGGLTEVFVHVGRAWAAALAELGVVDLEVYDGPSTARRLGTPREQLLTAVCFALPGKGEVLHFGRKLVGLAQRRRQHGALIQCGLLRRWDPTVLLRVLDPVHDPAHQQDEGPRAKTWAEIRAAAVGLETLLAPAPDNTKIIETVERWVMRTLDG